MVTHTQLQSWSDPLGGSLHMRLYHHLCADLKSQELRILQGYAQRQSNALSAEQASLRMQGVTGHEIELWCSETQA